MLDDSLISLMLLTHNLLPPHQFHYMNVQVKEILVSHCFSAETSNSNHVLVQLTKPIAVKLNSMRYIYYIPQSIFFKAMM